MWPNVILDLSVNKPLNEIIEVHGLGVKQIGPDIHAGPQIREFIS